MIELRDGFDRISGSAPDAIRVAAARPQERLAIRWQRRIVIVPIASIVRLEACDDHVLVCADRPYRHRETLTDLCARLPPGTMLRVHRSHAISVAAVRELHPRHHGEYALSLADGSTVVSGRAYRSAIEAAFDLA
jgi:two-component system, LytTR family, response regulator